LRKAAFHEFFYFRIPHSASQICFPLSSCHFLEGAKRLAFEKKKEDDISAFEGDISGYEGGLRGYEGGLRGYEGGLPGYEGGLPGMKAAFQGMKAAFGL